MMPGRAPPKIKPQTESRRESALPRNGAGRSGHAQNISRSIIDGDFSNASLQPESPAARKDQLQSTNKKSHTSGLTRSNSIRHEERNLDLSKIKKPVEHHYMKTTQCFNAKSKRPVDLDSPKVRKKADPDPYGTRRRSEDIRGLQRHKPAEPVNAYSKARSRSSSVGSQYTPILKRSPSVNSSRVPRHNTEKPAGEKKLRTREETEVENITSDHLDYTQIGESDVKEIIEDTSLYLHSNNQESMLEIDEAEIKADIISQTGNKNEIKLLEEPGDLDLSFQIPSEHESSEKLEDINQNLPEVETTVTIMEKSPSYLDSNIKIITENKILEDCEVTEETSTSEIEKEVTEFYPPEEITREIDENHEKHEVINTEYEEIDDLCVLSSSNDETEDLCEISIEDELSKFIVTENIHCTEQEKKTLSSDIMSIIEEIANEVWGMEKYQSRGNGDAWMPKTWKVDYVLQRLIQKLESIDDNQVSKLIQAYESVIQLMMRRITVRCQASSQ